MEHHHGPCCGCTVSKGMKRRTFLAAVGGSALGGAAMTGCVTAAGSRGMAPRMKPALEKKPVTVRPVLSCRLFLRQEQTSWRPWGGLFTMGDIEAEMKRIDEELRALATQAEFPVEILPVAKVMNPEQAEAVRKEPADVMLIYGATGDTGDIEALIAPERYNLMFLRHRSGPVYLWYEIAHPRMLRKCVDEYGQPGLETCDIVVDEYGDLLWRLRSLYALKNSVGSKIVAIGDASGWGAGGAKAPDNARERWKMDILAVSYDDLGKRIQAARADGALVKESEDEASAYLKDAGIKLDTETPFVSRAFLLTKVFERIMGEAGAQAITVNNCMSTIMPMSETTACLTLSLINDSGALAFCESDFVVIPSGVLLNHVAGTPVFLNDPTYPHHGVITLAHCTAPRRMDGKRLEKATILTHFESDYGAAPKVDMKLGQDVTVIDPDFASKRWIGFRGKIIENPFMAICRSQVDVAIEGDCDVLAQEMRGFHWMMSYGDHRKECEYAVHKLGIDWMDLTRDHPARV